MPRALRFYCRECEATFESEPDGTGYEQARCPQCGELCLTVQFEQEEQQRNRVSEALGPFVDLLASWMFPGLLIRLPSLPGEPPPDDTPENREKEADKPPSIPDPVTVCSFDYLGEAETCCDLLDHFGMESQLARMEGTNPFVPSAADRIAVQVASSDVERARDILEKYQSVQAKRREDHDEEGPVAFECEECGGAITLPAHRRGGVETCPHCGEYVDVPE